MIGQTLSHGKILVASYSLLVAACAAPSPSLEQRSQAPEAATIRRLLIRSHDNGEFTGSILVARAGTVVYRDAIASTEREARELLTTPTNIASLAKGFTAMAVMMLAEQGKLRYDDSVARYLPELASLTPSITIRHLLTHTSGIPDVGDLGIDRPHLQERDVLDAVRKHHSNFARPGLRYRYSNTGYMLVAMVVEKASGQRFDSFLQARIFQPLGMSHTRAVRGTRFSWLLRGSPTKGDGGIISTVDDLFKWTQALDTGALVRAETVAEALTPGTVEEGETTYGLGWNVTARDGDTYVWHTGNAGGYRAFIGRRLKDRITVIMLTKGSSRRTELADAIVNILRGQPYTPPKLSIGPRLLAAISASGIDYALALYDTLRTTEAATYDFSESELNGVGYGLLDRGDMANAVRIFQLNARHYPASSNAFDSLGDAYKRSGRKAEAIQAYSRALELDPNNLNARTMLQKLK